MRTISPFGGGWGGGKARKLTFRYFLFLQKLSKNPNMFLHLSANDIVRRSHNKVKDIIDGISCIVIRDICLILCNGIFNDVSGIC